MSKPVIFSLLALMCYSVTNVILEQKFSKFNNLTLMCVYMVPILVVAFIGRTIVKTSDSAFNFPVGQDLLLLVAIGVIFAAADYFYIGAYTNGGDLGTITCIIAMLPVVASIMKFVWTQSLPNGYQMAGYVLAFLAVLLVSKGSTVT